MVRPVARRPSIGSEPDLTGSPADLAVRRARSAGRYKRGWLLACKIVDSTV
jgi:hypothetical protein